MNEQTAIRKKDLRNWKAKGNKTTFYTCQYCNGKIETTQPNVDSVDSRGYWDTIMECPKCNYLNFVKVYPNGKTKVKKR